MFLKSTLFDISNVRPAKIDDVLFVLFAPFLFSISPFFDVAFVCGLLALCLSELLVVCSGASSFSDDDDDFIENLLKAAPVFFVYPVFPVALAELLSDVAL